jgi:hypothetical protein
LILKKDEQACQKIMERIFADEIGDEYRNKLLIKAKQDTRIRLIRQHEKNIKSEQRAGINKSYASME